MEWSESVMIKQFLFLPVWSLLHFWLSRAGNEICWVDSKANCKWCVPKLLIVTFIMHFSVQSCWTSCRIRHASGFSSTMQGNQVPVWLVACKACIEDQLMYHGGPCSVSNKGSCMFAMQIRYPAFKWRNWCMLCKLTSLGKLSIITNYSATKSVRLSQFSPISQRHPHTKWISSVQLLLRPILNHIREAWQS